MSKRPIFGLEPDQLDELLSVVTNDVDKSELDKAESSSSDRGELSEISKLAGTTASSKGPIEAAGSRIGPYKLLSILGEGGMGIVYLAEQERPIKRRVALKVIKPGMDSKRVTARFEAERQALALLDHPNIAHVYDAGTTENGRPYFVMEYVQGLPLTEHCDCHKLRIEDRLILFSQVCLAVHHAHQKGIIHRDIKPSNILVSKTDDQAVPKIIDFGVAKAINQLLTEKTLFTEQGQLFGTPEYMSPEQADMANEDIDTRSDIYSLGVLLYVLITGVLPFDSATFREGGIDHIRQVIREIDPKKPSTRLSNLGEEAKKVAESRRTELTTLTRCLRKELEWIPLKAMCKERSDRYRSASELANDVENYLHNAPLIAGPPKTVYKLKKFVRRNRALVTGVAAVLVVLVAGIITSMIFAYGQARTRTESQAVSDLLRHNVLASLDLFKVGGRDINLRSVLDAASEGLDEKFKGMPLAEAEIRDTLGNAYWSLGLSKKAELHLKRALDIQQTFRASEHPATLATAHQLGWVYYAQSRYPEAERLLVQTQETRRYLLGEEHPDTIYSTIALACVYTMQGRLKQGEELLSKNLEIASRVLGEEHLYVLGTMNALAWNYEFQGRYNDAEHLAEQGLEIARRVLGENDWVTLLLKHTLGEVCMRLGKYDKAEESFKEALKSRREAWGQEHPDTLQTMLNLGLLYLAQDRYEEAESSFVQMQDATRQVLGETHIFNLHLLRGLGTVYLSEGRHDEAKPLLDKAFEIGRRILGEENWVTLKVINTLANLYTAQGRYKEAEKTFRQALEGRKLKLGDDHPNTLESKNDLAMLYKEQARYEEAEKLLLDAVKGRRLKLGDNHPHTIESLKNLIALYEAWNKPEKADKWRAKLPQIEAKIE